MNMMKKGLTLWLALTLVPFLVTAQWQALNGPSGGEVSQIIKDEINSHLYAMSRNGTPKLYRSTDNGATWSLFGPTNINPLAVIPKGGTVYVADSYRMFVTTDNGTNWTRTNTSSGFSGNIIFESQRGDFIAGGWSGVYISSDQGVTWERIYNGAIYSDRSIVTNSNGDILLSDYYSGDVYRHLYPDTGTWKHEYFEKVHGQSVAYMLRSLAVDANDNFYMKETYYDYDQDQYVNNILGSPAESKGEEGSWVSVTTDLTTTHGVSMTSYLGNSFIEFANDGRLYFVERDQTDKILYTTSFGGNWTALPSWPFTNASIMDLLPLGGSTFMVSTYERGVMKSTDGGSTWTLSTTGIHNSNFNYAEVTDDGRIYLIGESVHYSDDGGSTWHVQEFPATIRNILRLPDGKLIAYGNGIFLSTDNGVNWSLNSSISVSAVVAKNTNELYGLQSNAIYYTPDQGTTPWTNIKASITGLPDSYSAYPYMAFDNGFLFIGIEAFVDDVWTRQLYKIELSTNTATKILDLPTDYTGYFTGLFVLDGKIYAGDRAKISISDDGGATWTTANFANEVLMEVPGGAIGSSNGSNVFYTTQDDGLTWINSPLPGTGFIRDIATDPNTGISYAATSFDAAYKNEASLIVPPESLPPFIDFNWEPTNGPYGAEITKLLRTKTGAFIGFSNGTVYKSDDLSLWQNITGTFGYAYAVAYDSTRDRILLSQYSRLFASDNGGATWDEINAENIVARYHFSSLPNGNLAFTGYENNRYHVYVSTDGGVTCGPSRHEFDSNQEPYKAVNTTDNVFVSMYDYGIGKYQILRFDLDGSNPTLLTLPESLDYLTNFSTTANEIFVWGDSRELYRSTDQGETWEDFTGNLKDVMIGAINYETEIVSGPGGERYLWDNGRRIYRSTDEGVSWEMITQTVDNALYTMLWDGPKMILATAEGVFVSTDGGASFTPNNTGIVPTYSKGIFIANQNKIYARENGPPYVSTNFHDWEKIDSVYINRYMVLPDDTYLAFSCFEYWRSHDHGNTWVRGTFNRCVYLMATPDAVNLYAAQGPDLYYSNNFAPWVPMTISGLPPNNSFEVTSLAADPGGILYVTIYNYTSSVYEFYQILFGTAVRQTFTADPRNVQFSDGKVILYDSNGAIFETTDGSEWITKGAPGGTDLIIASNGYYFIPQYNGVLWLSRDEGDTWQSVGLANGTGKHFTDVDINPYDGRAYATFDGGLPVMKSGNIVLPDDETAPVRATLAPANNATDVLETTLLTITFDEPVIPQSGKTLKIFNANNPVLALESIDVTAGTQDGTSISFTPTIKLEFLETYFIVLDNEAFKDIFGNAAAGIQNTTTWRFTIRDKPDKVNPDIASLSPANNEENVSTNINLVITFDEPVTAQSGKYITLRHLGSGNVLYAEQVTEASIDGNSFTFSPSVTLDYLETYFVNIDADAFLDAFENPFAGISDNTTWRFVVADAPDVTPPVITALAPNNGATNVGIGTSLVITFNEPVVAAPSLEVALFDANNDGSPIEVFDPTDGSISGNTVTFNPSGSLQYEGTYYVTIQSGAFADLSGNLFAGINDPSIWQFQIEPNPDQIPPGILSLTPGNDASNVSRSVSFTISFDEPVVGQPGKVISIFTLADSHELESFEATNDDLADNAYTFTPSTPLQYNVTYYITIDPDAFRDLAGNSFAGITDDATWRFTTELPPDNTPPTITYTPANFVKGSSNSISIQVADNTNGSGVDPATVKLYYRGIMSDDAPTSASMTAGSGNSWTVAVQNTWLDELGLEFYFEASDKSGNSARLPAGESFFTSYILQGNEPSGMPQVPPSYVGVGGKKQDYRMFSIPYDLGSNSISAIFSELGPVDKFKWRIVQYNNSNNSYSDATSISRGRGYWINTVESVNLAIENAMTPEHTKADLFTMQLQQGWNLIGNPYPFPIDWNAVKAGNTNIGDLKTYSGSFVTDVGGILSPFEGAFVMVNSGSESLTIPFSAKASTGGRVNNHNPFDGHGWLLPLTIESESIRNTLGGVGMHDQANTSYDPYDDFPMPHLFDVPELRFSHEEHFMKAFTRDIVPLSNEYTWDFTVSDARGITELSWGHEYLPGENDLELFLLDISAQRLINMRSATSYSFDADQSKQFRLFAGYNLEGNIQPTGVVLGEAWPNPATNAVSVPFTLPDYEAEYSVRLEVFDALGRRVALLEDGALGPDFHERVLDLEHAKLNSGIYSYRLTVNSQTVNTVQSKKLVVRR